MMHLFTAPDLTEYHFGGWQHADARALVRHVASAPRDDGNQH